MPVGIRLPFMFGLLLAITATAYSASLYGPFVFDDGSFIIHNRSVNFQKPIPVLRPRAVTLTTYRVNYLFGQEDPFGYHVASLLIHLANVVLVLFVVKRLVSSDLASLVGTALFALHPLQTEAVVYLSARTDLLATFFGLITLLLYLAGWRKLSALSLLFAISSKESAVVLLLIVGFIEIRRREVSVARAAAYFGTAMLALVPLIPSLHLESADRSWFAHLVLQSGQALRYAFMLIVPIGQTIDHDAETLPLWIGLSGLAGLAALIIVAWRMRFTTTGLGLGVTFLAALPRFVLNIPEFMAEHHLYLPMVGVSIAIAGCIETLEARKRDSEAAQRFDRKTKGGTVAYA